MIFNVNHILDKKNDAIFTISPDATVQEAVEIMAEKTISALPVIVDDIVVGIISERDYIRKAAPKRLLPWEIKIKELMTVEVISTTTTDSIHNCMKTMAEHRIRHLPVIENQQLIGMISISDVVRALRPY